MTTLYLVIRTTTPTGEEVGVAAVRFRERSMPACHCEGRGWWYQGYFGDGGPAAGMKHSGVKEPCSHCLGTGLDFPVTDVLRRTLAARTRQHAALYPGVAPWPVARVDVVERLGEGVARTYEVEVMP